MRYRLMATYRGVPYEAGIGPTDSDVVLFAACPPPEELGFEPATGHWRKQLRIQEVQALWESRPMGMFRGDRCIVLDDLGDRLHIAYLGHDAYQAEQLGYWQVDRGVFELITPRDEVKEIVEERIDYPHRPAGTGADAGAGAGAEIGTGGGVRPSAAVTPPPPPDLAAQVLDGRADDTVTRDLAVIPPTREAPLPLEAAARRAAAARSLKSPRRPSRQSQPTSLDPVQPSDLNPAQPSNPHPAQPPSQSQRPNMRPAQPPGNLTQPPSLPPAPPSNHHAQPSSLHPVQAPSQLAQPPNLPPAQSPSQEPEPPSPRRRRSSQRRLATQRIFSELAGLAAIPPSAYAVGEEIDGAMCLTQTPDGFEVFNAAAGARHEVRLFDDEESAYFYLFGVLAAEAVRTGRLVPQD